MNSVSILQEALRILFDHGNAVNIRHQEALRAQATAQLSMTRLRLKVFLEKNLRHAAEGARSRACLSTLPYIAPSTGGKSTSALQVRGTPFRAGTQGASRNTQCRLDATSLDKNRIGPIDPVSTY